MLVKEVELKIQALRIGFGGFVGLLGFECWFVGTWVLSVGLLGVECLVLVCEC